MRNMLSVYPMASACLNRQEKLALCGAGNWRLASGIACGPCTKEIRHRGK